MSADVVAAIIQGGAVGLAFFMMVIIYLLARRGMEIVNTFITNHLKHLTESIDNNTKTVTLAVDKNTAVLTKLDETIVAMNRRM